MGGTTDREYIEAVDERFTERVKEILNDLEESHHVYARPNVIPIAEQILDLYQTNANRGAGIGIDEWENAPANVLNHPNDHLRANKKKPKGAIRRNLKRELGTNSSKIDYALGALRVSTTRALREGWLDYHSNPSSWSYSRLGRKGEMEV